ncbi:MAG: N-acetylmuramoyl-L-alanine amidase [Dehalococcoidales bacterium]|nr:N-acetylmuramoyl-L-alanine amidase [Dehalococcoidales bacterium]
MIIDISDCSTVHHPLRKTIVIDPGHGGKDPGAVANGLIEKELNLKFSLELKRAIEQTDYAVELTRSNDTFIELSKRKDFRPGAALFLSIHHNSSANKNANGVEAYYKPGSAGGKKIAGLLSAEIANTCGLRNRGAKEGRFTVLQRKSPAVLIELGFISNPGEASVIRTEGFVRLAVKAIVKAIDNR